jgi:hydrogenase maturation protease
MIAELSPAALASTITPNVVIGLGNEIAGDDGVGIEVASLLRQRFHRRSDLEIVSLSWAGFALLDVLHDRHRAAIIDCLITGNHPPGAIVRIDESDLGGSIRLNSFHDINYPTALALGRHLGWKMPASIAIWGIEAASADTFTEELSAPVAAAVPRVADQVAEFLGLATFENPHPARE